ncbi:Ran GTPase-activating protein 1 [Phlyctochytrium planicorne]|nr:Ran GTPase-activating protein 1 [Phlyctochytrium planicorne]
MLFSIEGRVLKLNTADDVKDIIKDIQNTPGIEEMCLGGNTIGVEAAKALAQAIKPISTLKSVNFSDMFTGRLKEEIPLALDAFVDALIDKKLDVVNFSDNAFGPAGAGPLRRLFIENRSIKYLRLQNNGLGIEGAKLISSALIEAVEKAKEAKEELSLTTLIMGRNRLQSDGAIHMSKAIALLPKLKELRMPENSIRPEGIVELLASLKGTSSLEILDLQDNTFTDVGSKALSETLPSWKSLKHLNVGDCLTGKKGSQDVIKTLTAGSGILEELIFTFNEMEESGLRLLPEFLAKNPKIKTIHLNGNAFDPEHEVVKQLKRLLEGNGFPDALDELDEMEFDEDEEDDGDGDKEEDEDEEKEEKADEDVDELTKGMSSLSAK